MSRTGWPGVGFTSGRTSKQPGGTRKQVRQLKAQHHPVKAKSRRGVKSRRQAL